MHELQREASDLADELHRQVTRSVVEHRFSILKEFYIESPRVLNHLDEMAEDIKTDLEAERSDYFWSVFYVEPPEAERLSLIPGFYIRAMRDWKARYIFLEASMVDDSMVPVAKLIGMNVDRAWGNGHLPN